jgi:hypothetical protein
MRSKAASPPTMPPMIAPLWTPEEVEFEVGELSEDEVLV